MKTWMLFIVAIVCCVMATHLYEKNKKNKAQAVPVEKPDVPVIKPVEKVPDPPKPVKVEPKFINYPKLRNVDNASLGKSLQDIDSHMPAGHTFKFSNKVTWAHETTHGINSSIRNKNISLGNINAFYCLEDRGCIIYEPKTTIAKVAPVIPKGLRGPSYDLYLVSQRKDWNDRPLYIFDEWIAYTNGSETGRELNYSGWYYELLQAHNFNVYAICVAMTVKKECPDYDDTQMKAFMMWNIERTFRLMEPMKGMIVEYPEPVVGEDHNKPLHEHPEPPVGDDKNPVDDATKYVEKVRTSPEGEEIRKFARSYFGAEWCKKVYGF